MEDLKFEREKWEDEKKFRDREIVVKELEQETQTAELELKQNEQKSFGWRNPLVIAILAATIAALGNAAVTVVNGILQRTLEDDKSEQARILEMIKTGDADKAASNLDFLLKAGLIDDKKRRNRLTTFLAERKPGSGPTLPTQSGIIVPSSADTSGFTDFTIFVCDAAWSRQSAQRSANSLIESMRRAGRVGQITLRPWSSYSEVPFNDLKDKLTVIVDKGSGEEGELPRLESIFRSEGFQNIQTKPNKGKSTRWLISIILCPSA
jgi:hypothetical protein